MKRQWLEKENMQRMAVDEVQQNLYDLQIDLEDNKAGVYNTYLPLELQIVVYLW